MHEDTQFLAWLPRLRRYARALAGKALAGHYEQLAIVWASGDAVPKLIQP